MFAAKTNFVEAVQILLDKNANPDAVDRNNFTALTYAILSDNSETTEKLLPKTTKYLDISLSMLAKSNIKANKNIVDEVVKIFNNKNGRELFKVFVMKASFFGKADWLEILFDRHPDHLKSR